MVTQLASSISVRSTTPAPAVRQDPAAYRVLPGTVLFAEGDDADCVFEVVSGTLRLHKAMADGRRQIIGFVSGGRLLGVAQKQEYLCTAEAVTPLMVRRIKRPAFERRIDEDPGFARTLLREICNELRMAQDQMLLLGRKSAMEKLASFLLSVATDEDGDVADHVDLPMPRGDIVDYLGLTTETVSRTFTKLKNDGLLALPCAASVEILDHDRLEELATGAAGDDAWSGKGAGW